uniref:Uncharacterized protein n=1 Tax=Anopheles dirus TaxID=7168 RepID=A0A182N701_9DIPT
MDAGNGHGIDPIWKRARMMLQPALYKDIMLLMPLSDWTAMRFIPKGLGMRICHKQHLENLNNE